MDKPVQRRPERREEDFGCPKPSGWSTAGLGRRSLLRSTRASASVGFDNVFRMGVGLMFGISLARALFGDHWFRAIWFGVAVGLFLSIPPALVVLRSKRELPWLGTTAFFIALLGAMLIRVEC